MSPWNEALVELNDETRADANTFISEQGFLGGTAIYDAVETAFQDVAAENIYLLSDGEPMGGLYTRPADIRITHHGRFTERTPPW